MTKKYIKCVDLENRLHALCAAQRITAQDAIDIALLPAADVAPVVLCKDCKYGVLTKNGFHNDMIACENKDSPCGYSSWLCQLDWFCADGERRVDDEN